ncbi:enoyl-CoA hydratase [Thalassospiraceae bacterium SW-3-3]|nr:enoyl-CoA hydratase [Thalassospiraceae bacterium SW-3-3]
MTSTDAVLLSITDQIATITLNRPDRMNALDQSMIEGLGTALDRIEADIANIGAVIIEGSGGTFMAGGDVKFFYGLSQNPVEESRPQIETMINRVHDIIIRLTALPRPVIAKLDGAVAGFGISLMNACDLAVAAEETVFTLAYIHIGTSPDGGSTHSLPRLVGMKKAKEIAFLGDRFTATDAHECGLVNKVVPADQLASATAKYATRLAAGPRDALARTKALLNTALEHDLAEQLELEAKAFTNCAGSHDFREGVSAFVEKRSPQFGKS